MTNNYLSWILAGIGVLNVFFNIGTWFYVRRENNNKVTTDRFKDIEGRVIVIETKAKDIPDLKKSEARLTQVEAKVQSMPVCGNHDRMEENDVKLFKRFDDLHGDIRELTGGVKGLTRAVDMINEFLLKERK